MKKKIRLILILSLVFMVITLVVSFFIESRSHKLPAVILSDKVFVSSETDGILKKYYIQSMQEVIPQTLIAELENSRLQNNLEALKNEKQKYEKLIQSAKSGARLDTELYSLDEDIQKHRINLEEARLDIAKSNEKLLVMNERYAAGKKKYDASKKLYEQGILNNSDFDRMSRDFWNLHDDYNELKGDSLVAAEVVKSSQNIINLLEARKKIMSSNVDILAARYLIDLNEVEANIAQLEQELKGLLIYSPITGVVTDFNYRPGEKIGKGNVVVEIADLSNVWIIAYGTSSSRHKVKPGQKVRIYCSGKNNIMGKVTAVSPVMERVRALSTAFETVSTFTKIEIKFDDMKEALMYITPGERLFVRIYF